MWLAGFLRVVCAAAILILVSPLMLLITFLLLVSSRDPVLYRGLRVGRAERTFTMYKFRSLRMGTEEAVGERLARGEDRAVSRLGALLRPSKLDELPQLFNVLRGDMGFVGPRPVRPVSWQVICRS